MNLFISIGTPHLGCDYKNPFAKIFANYQAKIK